MGANPEHLPERSKPRERRHQSDGPYDKQSDLPSRRHLSRKSYDKEHNTDDDPDYPVKAAYIPDHFHLLADLPKQRLFYHGDAEARRYEVK